MRYLVVPARPAGIEGWSENQLASVVTRDCTTCLAVPKATS